MLKARKKKKKRRQIEKQNQLKINEGKNKLDLLKKRKYFFLTSFSSYIYHCFATKSILQPCKIKWKNKEKKFLHSYKNNEIFFVESKRFASYTVTNYIHNLFIWKTSGSYLLEILVAFYCNLYSSHQSTAVSKQHRIGNTRQALCEIWTHSSFAPGE